MKLLVNDAVLLTKREFKELLEYSCSFPTGQTPGKAWKARRPYNAPRDRAEWWRGVYGKPYPEGHEHYGQIPIGWRRIQVEGQSFGFPREVRIAPPSMRGLPADAPEGDDEGLMCLRDAHGGKQPICLGTIEYMRDQNLGGCRCFIGVAPCSSCTSTMPECPKCGWRMEE